jgi:alkylation response protein AidB-like acyl-CoA dehydrogenase
MDFDLSDNQLAVRVLAGEVFAKHADPERLAGVEAGAERFDRELWRQLGASGVLGLAVPGEDGGEGLGLSEFVIALIEQGRRVPLVPLWETVVLGVMPIARFGTRQQQATWLPRVAAGWAVLTAALEPSAVRATADGTLTGSCVSVPAGHLADAVVVPAVLDDGPGGGSGRQQAEPRPGRGQADRLFLVDTAQPGVSRRPFERTDRALGADLILDGAAAEPLDGGPDEDRCEWLRYRAWAGLAALQLGVSQESVRRAAAYTAERHQFGVPLATFQAVAHQAADCHIDTQAMEVTFWDAVWRLDTGRPAAAAVHVARWWAAEAGDRVARVVQHLHGGLGADITYPIHRYMLWSSQLANTLGSAAWHLDRIGELVARGTG